MSRRRRYDRYRRRRKKNRYDIKKIVLFAVLVIAAIGLLIILGSQILSHKDEYYKQGTEYYNKGDYATALEYFNDALDEKQLFSKKTDMNIHMYIADICLQQQRYTDAVDEYKRVELYKKADKEQTEILKNMSQALSDFNKGNYAGTVDLFMKAAEAGYTTMYVYAGTCYEETEQYDKMLECYDKYIAEYGYNSYLYTQLAAYYLKTGDLDQAYGYIQTGLTSDKTYNLNLRLLEIAYYEAMSNYDEAFGLVSDLLTQYPDNEQAQKEYDFLYTRASHDKGNTDVTEGE